MDTPCCSYLNVPLKKKCARLACTALKNMQIEIIPHIGAGVRLSQLPNSLKALEHHATHLLET